MADNPNEIQGVLRNKLTVRNFEFKFYEKKNKITIDTLFFSEKLENVNVYSNDHHDCIGSYSKENIKIEIIGNINIDDTINHRVTSNY